MPLRIRVTVAFAMTATVAVVGLGVFLYLRVESTLVDQTRSSLRDQLEALGEVSPDSRVQAVAGMDGATYAQLLGTDGTVLASSPQVAGALLPADGIPDDGERFETRAVALVDDREPETALLLAQRHRDQVVVVGTSREDISDALQGVLTQLLIGGPLLLVLASAAGYLVAGAALRPVGRMERQAAQISAQRSTERLPLPAADDELRSLGVTLNAMLDRLDDALQNERRFVAEASHELRTPLALLRTELDLALSRPRSHEELLEALRSANEEVERLTRLSEQLLPLASSARTRPDRPVDLVALAGTVADRFSTTAMANGRVVRVVGERSLLVHGDRDALDRAVSNLVDNALRHGRGDVVLVTTAQDGQIVLEVSDEGRQTEAGGESRGGSGLGLAIVRGIIEGHQGSLVVDAGREGGTTATVRLPRCPEHAT